MSSRVPGPPRSDCSFDEIQNHPWWMHQMWSQMTCTGNAGGQLVRGFEVAAPQRACRASRCNVIAKQSYPMNTRPLVQRSCELKQACFVPSHRSYLKFEAFEVAHVQGEAQLQS